MGAGHKHTSVGTVHVKAGHAVVFECETHIEDAGGDKHPVKSENKVIHWDDLKKVMASEDLAVLEKLGPNLLDLHEKVEAAKAEAAKKAAEEKPSKKGKKAEAE